MKRWTKLFYAFTLLFLIVIIGCWFANKIIIQHSSNYIFSKSENIPPCKTALLLGTIKTLSNGQPNLFFYNRIEAVVTLYKEGKIKFIVVSGDNSQRSYNEPEDMKQALMKRGIPEAAIYLDFAGFRTLDSVVRVKEIFGQEKIIIVSQKFHNERAVYIAHKNGIEAYGYNAEDVNKYMGFKTHVREFFAKGKVFIDLLLNIQPKFLGDKVIIKN